MIDFINSKNKELDFYSKFSFDEVWNFINPDNLYYEIRIKGKSKEEKVFNYIRDLAKLIKAPYHWTGVFITTKEQFKKACYFGIKNKLTMYLSVQPKRKSFHSKEKIKIKKYNGEKQSELGFYNIFLDFDPTKKLKALGEDTENECYKVARHFLNENTNIKKYIFICSGHGIQLRIPLDTPIMFPVDKYDENNCFIEDTETATYFSLMKIALKDICLKYSTDLVSIDISGLEVSRVGRLPFSKNFKKEPYKSCGVIEIVNNDINHGLHDYIMSFYNKNLVFMTTREIYKNKQIAEQFLCDENNIRNTPLIKLLLKKELPSGDRNRVLFFQLKVLLKNCGINTKSEKITQLIRDIERVQKDTIALNDPGDVLFNPNAIINYCVNNKIPPIYPVLYDKITKRQVKDEWFDININKIHDKKIILDINILSSIYKNINKENLNNIYLLKLEINKIILLLLNTFDKDYLEYLINHKILKTIFEKI
jgi:hypothetical protein